MKQLRRLGVFCVCALLFSEVVVGAEKNVDDAYVATVDSDGVQRVRIVGGEYFFKPNRIMVKVNVLVEFSVSREAGVVPHSLVIEAPAAGIAVDEDLSTEVRKLTFTPTARGTHLIYCKNKLLFFKSHRERGMEGILEVVP